MNHYALTGASFPLKISGKEFAAYSFTDKDYRELDSYIQSKVISVAMKALPSELTTSERTEWQQSTIRAAAATGWGTNEGIRIMNTNEGYWRLGWQMIRKEATVTFESFAELAQKGGEEQVVANLVEIDTVFVTLNTDDEEEDKDEEKEGASEEDAPGTSKSRDVQATD